MKSKSTKKIVYESDNGYTGVLYGKSSFAIKDAEGNVVFHTGFRNIETLEELTEQVEGFPGFLEKLRGVK